MATNASPEKIRTAGMVLAKISAYDPTFRHDDDAVVLAWATALTLANVASDVAVEAVDHMYANAKEGFRPLPGVLIGYCRMISANRSAHQVYEPPDKTGEQPVLESGPKINLREWEERHRDEYPEGFPNSKVGRELPNVPVPPQYKRFGGNPDDVVCSYCNAQPGHPCTSGGRPLERSRAHPSRMEAAGAEPIPPSRFQGA